MLPSGYSFAWNVWREPFPELTHSGTATQLTTTRPASLRTRTPPAVSAGLRSSNRGEIRGGPAVIRPRERSVLALSAAVKVMLPSEFTYISRYVAPKNGNA